MNGVSKYEVRSNIKTEFIKVLLINSFKFRFKIVSSGTEIEIGLALLRFNSYVTHNVQTLSVSFLEIERVREALNLKTSCSCSSDLATPLYFQK